MKQRPHRRHDSGFVIVTFSMMLVALTLMIGFAVDLGSWYLRASKLQRAADVAALSAASSLPDTVEASAIARQALEHNGLTEGPSISFDIESNQGTVTVSVTDTDVPTYFLGMLFSSITLDRESQAQKLSTIPLGSPFNVFGGTLAPGSSGPGFVAAINGICAPQEDGDLFGAKYEANKTVNSHVCDPPEAQRNPRYRAPEGGDNLNGYTYLVDVPAGAEGPVTIDALDPGYGGDADTALDREFSQSGGDMNTGFTVYRTDGSGNEANDQIVANITFRDGSGHQWERLYQEPGDLSGPRQYKIKVFMEWRGFPDAFVGVDVNGYSLIAYTGTDRVGCDTRTQPDTCPKLYGSGAISVYNNFSGSDQSTFFLAEILPSFIGSTFEVYMWDPGEGAQSIELLSPNDTPVPFRWSVEPSTNLQPEQISGNGSVLDVSGTGPQPSAGIQGNGKYNARMVTLEFDVDDYTALHDSDGDYWWKIRYTVADSVDGDRITYGVKASTASPAHLSK